MFDRAIQNRRYDRRVKTAATNCRAGLRNRPKTRRQMPAGFRASITEMESCRAGALDRAPANCLATARTPRIDHLPTYALARGQIFQPENKPLQMHYKAARAAINLGHSAARGSGSGQQRDYRLPTAFRT